MGILILTNDNPRSEPPDEIVRDIVAGWPDKILLQHGWFLYPWYQDIGRLPIWITDQNLWAQSEVRRFIIEDRFIALRSAIYSAQKGDVVVIAGKGNEDYQEWIGRHVFEDSTELVKKDPRILEQLVKGWFDDRIECQDAISKLHQVNALFPGLNRSVMPWLWTGLHRRHPLEDWDYEDSANSLPTQTTTDKRKVAGLRKK